MKTYLKLTPFWLFSSSICAQAHAAEVPLSQCTVEGAFPLKAAFTTHDDAITYEQAFVDRMVELHDLSASEWSNGWGWEAPLDPDLPFGRMINALRLLHGAARVGVPQDNIVYWAGDYVENVGHEIKPLCADARGRAVRWPNATNTIKVGPAGFNDNVWRRAGTLVHETRHHETGGHDLAHVVDCPGGGSTPETPCCRRGGKSSATDTDGSCDRSFYDWGANSIHVYWLAEAVENNAFVVTARHRDKIVDQVNEDLEGRFAEDPGFRMASSGPELGQLYPTGASFHSLQSKAGDDWNTPTLRQLGSTSDTACFLTQITGMFRNGGYGFALSSDGDPVDPQWQLASRTLSPNGSESGIGVRGRCVSALNPVSYEGDLELNGAILWGGRDIPLGEPTDGRVCFLTGLGGTLQNSLEGAWVAPDGGAGDDSEWVLHLDTAAQNGSEPLRPLFASVQCIDGELVHGPVSGGEEGSEHLIASDAGGLSAMDTYCAISGVTGKFEGQDEAVEILPFTDATTSYPVSWTLSRRENRLDGSTVYGHSVCFRPD